MRARHTDRLISNFAATFAEWTFVANLFQLRTFLA